MEDGKRIPALLRASSAKADLFRSHWPLAILAVLWLILIIAIAVRGGIFTGMHMRGDMKEKAPASERSM
jgi:hypothetical protein